MANHEYHNLQRLGVCVGMTWLNAISLALLAGPRGRYAVRGLLVILAVILLGLLLGDGR